MSELVTFLGGLGPWLLVPLILLALLLIGYFDLYCTQPECRMLVALKEDKLAARALVWTIGDKTFMDRVYYIEDSLYNIFVNYAKENK